MSERAIRGALLATALFALALIAYFIFQSGVPRSGRRPAARPSPQQAARVADTAAFFLSGDCVEYGPCSQMFIAPSDKRTKDYVTDRFG